MFSLLSNQKIAQNNNQYDQGQNYGMHGLEVKYCR